VTCVENLKLSEFLIVLFEQSSKSTKQPRAITGGGVSP